MKRVFVALWMLALGCTSADEPVDPFQYPVDQPGPFQAGFHSVEITYTPGPGLEARQITVNVWYPTEVTSGIEARYMDAFPDAEAFVDAPLAPAMNGATYPVHVYSHGHRGFGGTSAFLMRHFASHGWMVVAPDHLTNTLLDNVDPKLSELYVWRGTDIRASLDTVENLEFVDAEYGVPDTTNVLMSGHSFGAYSTWLVGGASVDVAAVRAECEAGELDQGDCAEAEFEMYASGLSDSRVKALMPMAGTINRTWFPGDAHTTVLSPVLFMSGTADQVGQAEQYETIDGVDFTWLDIDGGCHQMFALGGCSLISDETAFQIVNSYGLAFGRKTIQGDDSEHVLALMNGSVLADERVSFQQKP
jgi:predicted dienelactone hydrolase